MPGDDEVETAEWLALRVEGVIPGVEVLRLGRLAGELQPHLCRGRAPGDGVSHGGRKDHPEGPDCCPQS